MHVIRAINPAFVRKQGVSDKTVLSIQAVHEEIEELFDNADFHINEKGHQWLHDAVTDLDFKLQDLWGFERDRDYHTYWYRIPNCICPVMDNIERQGTGLYIINKNCPFHGDNT